MKRKLLGSLALAMISVPAFAQQPPPPTPPPTPPPSRWPAEINTAEGQVTFFQPQLISFQGDVLADRSAVSVQLTGQQDPVFGAVWVQHHVSVDQANDKLQLLDSSVTQTRFPNADATLDRAVSDGLAQLFTGPPVVIALDKVQATLATVQKEQVAADQIQSAPPKIAFYDHPVVKVQYDGTPRLQQVDNSNLLRAVNTPFFVVLDPASKTYFLKGGGYWFGAPDPLGPFARVDAIPQPVIDLASSSGYQDPQQPLPADQAAAVQIVTATDPTEVIYTNGPAQLSTLSGTALLYVANTDSDLFTDIDNQQQYLLLSGRWYSAPRREGPWAFVSPDQLPVDFRRIPPDSEKAGVLVSVPGSAPAQAAVADAFIPQTAAVDLNNFQQPEISYDGVPNFQPIEGAGMTYAVNTSSSVIFAEGQYYCCFNGVWYQSPSAVGPWFLAFHVPGEIYTIPPSYPIYPVRFVYVYGHHGDAVYYGYLPGYLGSYVYHGVVVYGTGYAYHPWIGRAYFARPDTYGFAAHYDFFTGHWGFNFALALGGGFDWVAVGPHVRGDVFFGHAGFHPVYARDALHIGAARAVFARDAVRHAEAGNLYARRTDVRLELAHSPVVPRGVVVRAEVRGAPHPDARPEARPEDRRPEARPEARPEDHPEVRPDAARDAHPDAAHDDNSAAADRGRGATPSAQDPGRAGQPASRGQTPQDRQRRDQQNQGNNRGGQSGQGDPSGQGNGREGQ